jgi:membrane protease subunit HflK
MQQIYTNSTKILVDARQGNNLLYLPLDKLMNPSQGATTPVPSSQSSAGNAAPPAVAPDSDSRSRDALRNRDRDSR